jgi:putative phosphoesterase
MKVGLIADTHAQLHPNLASAFRGVDAILHAGDVGSEAVLAQLAALAPVTAIHGNADPPALQRELPARRVVRLAGTRVLLVHQAQAGRHWLPEVRELIAAEHPEVVVFGHSHLQYVARHDGTLFVNPGGGGRRRFRLRRSVAILRLEPQPNARIVWLDKE